MDGRLYRGEGWLKERCLEVEEKQNGILFSDYGLAGETAGDIRVGESRKLFLIFVSWPSGARGKRIPSEDFSRDAAIHRSSFTRLISRDSFLQLSSGIYLAFASAPFSFLCGRGPRNR